MLYRSIAPTGDPLRAVVDRIWVCAVDGAGGDEILLPTGWTQLIFGLDPGHPTALVQGMMTRPAVIDAAPQRLAAGVVLRPGGLRALTGEAASAFTDRQVDVADAMEIDGVGLIEELRHAVTHQGEVAILERLVSGRLAAINRPPSSEVEQVTMLLKNGCRVRESRDLVGMSRARLLAAFRTEIGTTPKLFARILRFESAVARVRSPGAGNLADIAAELGYADQAHMTREFKDFADISPGALHRDGSPAPNHLTR